MSRPCGVFDEKYEKDQAIFRTRTHWFLLAAALVFVFSLPSWIGGQVLNTLNLIAITIIAVQGVNILTGMTGQITLGQSAFMAVGAYSMYLMVVYLQFNFWLSLPIAMLISGISGLVFGIPSLRIKGFYLAMATLAAQFIIPWMIINIRPDLTGGVETVSFPSPRIGDFVFNTQENIFYLVFVFAILAIYFARNIQRSRIGRAFIAIRDNDLAAEIMGISIFRYKLLSFFICSIYAGLAGVLLAVWIRGVSYELFGLHESIWFLGMLILGGLGSVPGVCFGVFAIQSLEILVRYSGGIIRPLFNPEIGRAIELGIAPIVFGVVVLSFIIFEPKGLAQIWERIKNFYRSWPFSY